MPTKEEAEKQKEQEKCDCTKDKDCMRDKTEEEIKAEKKKEAEKFARLENKAEVYARTVAQLCETSARVHELWLSTHEDASAEEKHKQLVAAIKSSIMIALMNI